MSITDIVRRLQVLEPAWFSRNSYVNEMVGGALGTLLIAIVIGPIKAVIAFQILSIMYERTIDPNGWSLDDVLQRLGGSLIAAALWILV